MSEELQDIFNELAIKGWVEEVGKIRQEIERLKDIIKETREYITTIEDENIQYTIGWVKQDILQILDKEDGDKE